MKRYFLSVFILIWCSSRLLKSAGDDTIIPGQIIRVNENITSTAEKFVLGFFKPPNSTSLYVGVWYALNKIPLQTVIWVANREKPITDSSPVLSVTSQGDLVILVNNNTVFWSSNSSNATATPFQADIKAVLLDYGNVVLRQNNTQTWQSFDYPTDTFLPGMKISLDLKTRKTTLLTSWKDDNNPAAGKFSVGIDPNWPASQLVIWRSNSNTSSPFWRSGIWSGIKSFGSTDVSNYLSYLTVGATEEELYITVTNSDPNIVSRFILNKSGKILPLSWNSISRVWDQLILVPQSECDFCGRCGPSGSCYNGGARISGCRCLEGYAPRIQKQGCQRQNPLECKKSNTFQMME